MWSLLWPWAWIIIPGSHSREQREEAGREVEPLLADRRGVVAEVELADLLPRHVVEVAEPGPAAIDLPRDLPLPKILRQRDNIPGRAPATPGSTPMSTIEIRPLTAAIGAEVSGVDLREPLADDDVACLRQALLDHLVLFFRDQDIDDDQQLAFALRFGPMHVSPLQTVHQDAPEIVVLDQVHPKGEGADEWHSDNTFLAEPPMGSILRAVQLPEVGGDTCFASMYAAYEALSPAMRELRRRPARGPRHHHARCRRRSATATPRSTSRETQQKCPPVEHNVVVTHPETGRKALFVNRNSTTHIVGLTERENDVLLPFLFDHVRSPEFQCRFHWEQGSIAFWDNRAVQHYAVADYHERRVMHRATIARTGRRGDESTTKRGTSRSRARSGCSRG